MNLALVIFLGLGTDAVARSDAAAMWNLGQLFDSKHIEHKISEDKGLTLCTRLELITSLAVIPLFSCVLLTSTL